MVEVVVLVVVILAILSFAIWFLYQSAGTVTTTTSWRRGEVADSLVSYFVPDGWKLEHRAGDFLVFKRGASGCTGLIWLVIFLPLGLVYLLTDLGRGKLTARFWRNRDGATEVELRWNNAAIRRQIGRVLEALEED